MKKTLTSITLLLVGSLVYYFIYGSQQITQELKRQVDMHLEVLQKNGFAIEEREIKESSEHFVLHYKDPTKIQKYFKEKNIKMKTDDTQMLKGFKLASDISYMQGFYSAVSMDLYPVALPEMIREKTTQNDLNKMQKLLKEKIFLIHLDINKIFTSFKGYVKDIDTTFGTIKVVSTQVKFDGDFTTQRLTASTSSIQEFSINTATDLNISLKNLHGTYKQKGDSPYSFDSKQQIDMIAIQLSNGTSVELKNLDFQNNSNSSDQRINSQFISKFAELHIIDTQNRYSIENLNSKISLEKLSISALETLQSIDINNPKERQKLNKAIKMLITDGTRLNIEYIKANKVLDSSTNKMVDGFDANAYFTLNKNINLREIQSNPFALLSAVESKAHISLSDSLYNIAKKRAELSLILLFVKPISKEQKKIFDITYQNSHLKINGNQIL